MESRPLRARAALHVQEILDQVIAGRVSGHRCPFCEDTTIVAEADEYFVSVKCTSCGRWIEGQLR